MPPRSHIPLRKVTLNLFDADCAAMERRYGHGWSERVRNMVRSHLESVVAPRDELAQIYGDELEEDEHG